MFRKAVFLLFITTFSMVQYASSQSINPLEPKFGYEDCGCKININLRIFYGLYGNYGGQEVLNKDEETKGAVTVANKNDTNGNGPIDASEKPIIATPNGRNEIDLMALIIEAKGVTPDCPADNVILEYQGNIKFWESSSKSNEITTLSFPINTLPKTIWVEAPDVSTTVRDIIIKAHINDLSNPVQDIVKATAIWCEKQQVYYRDVNNFPFSRRQDPEPSSAGIDNQDLIFIINDYSFWNPDQTRYGYGVFGHEVPALYLPKNYGGRILFEFITLPLGIEKEFADLGIKMDISRRKTTNHEFRILGNYRPQYDQKSPLKIELPNDDPEDPGCPTGPGGCDALDEDANPKNKELYSYDTPSVFIDGYNTPFSIAIYEGSFQEYCRVSFKDEILGEIEEGSKCSEFLDWNIKFPLVRTKKIDFNDPYNEKKLELEPMLYSGVVSTVPTLRQGNGNGSIIVEMYGDYDAGYRLEFDNLNDRWGLIGNTSSNSWTQFSNVSSTGPWDIIRPGWMKVHIENNNSINFSANTILLFNSYVFNNHSIIQEFNSN